MKLVKNYMKSVVYNGIELSVPFDTKYLAVDRDGQIFAYNNEPSCGRGQWYDCDCETVIARIDLEGADWRESLVEVA